MKEHLHILELAAQNELPATIDRSSALAVGIVRELIDAGFIKAIDASSTDGMTFLDAKITLAGREYLAQLKKSSVSKRRRKTIPTDVSKKVATVIIGGPEAWLEIRSEFGVSKGTLGKRIAFVKDEFKREVIFRDIEQAFLLAHYGFNKPSVILAGGVIEELLRLYLGYKNVKSDTNTLDSYIAACEKNGLIKGAIHRLADSVRQFRNIVHLARESSPRNSISKATAKGAVASVFTIANDFAA